MSSKAKACALFVVIVIVAAAVVGALVLLSKNEPSEYAAVEENQPQQQSAVTWDDANRSIIFDGNAYQFVAMPAMSWWMGSSSGDERPRHNVVTTEFEIGATEVPQWLWVAVMGANPSKHRGATLPVENISWNDCNRFIAKLNELTGQTFVLPTETQWEFAARAQSSVTTPLTRRAWFKDNSCNTDNSHSGATHPVATKDADSNGVYDMLGNVKEWCRDAYHRYGGSGGREKVVRGGGFKSSAQYCTPTARSHRDPNLRNDDIGLRLVLEPANFSQQHDIPAPSVQAVNPDTVYTFGTGR